MKRICVIGCGGAGKSTLSRTLSKKLKLPLIHLDVLFWTAGWIPKEQETFDQELRYQLQKNSWIVDGNFPRTMPERFQKADTVIWLDYSRWRNLYGVFKRLITNYGQNRDDMPEGCFENFDWNFLQFVWRFDKESKPLIVKNIEQEAQHCDVIVFKTPKETKTWLQNITEA